VTDCRSGRGRDFVRHYIQAAPVNQLFFLGSSIWKSVPGSKADEMLR
jgi:hypothetical protein